MTSQLGIVQSVLGDFVLGAVLEPAPTINRTASDVLAFSETNAFSIQKNRSADDTLTFTEKFFTQAVIVDSDDTLTLTETFSGSSEKSRSRSDTLTFSETFTRNQTLHRSCSDTLTFIENPVKSLSGVDTTVPSYIGTQTTRYNVLTGFSTSIVLPTPVFGDGEANGDVLTVFRTATNRRVITVKRQEMRSLSYDFEVTRKKAVEFKNFIETEISNQVTWKNWKGEIWVGRIDTNPFVTTAQGRWGPCTEKVSITLELKAVRIH